MNKIPLDGVIKFNYKLKMTPPLLQEEFIEIEKWRAIFYRMNLIGEYPTEKVGFGNLSKLDTKESEAFIITGTQTGKYPNLDGSHYTKVTHCNLKKMSVEAKGPIPPSSESLTHFAIYEANPKIKFVFHVHHKDLWNFMIKENLESTPKDIPYGTFEMALACKKCIGKKTGGFFVMKGHEDGVVSFGETADEAGKYILDLMKQINT